MTDFLDRLVKLLKEDPEYAALLGLILAKKDHEMALASRARL